MSLKNASEMQKTFKLPMLPGNTCGEELLRRNFRKTQCLTNGGGKSKSAISVPIDFDSTNVVSNAKSQTLSGSQTLGSTQQAQPLQVLRFYGYFMDNVQESALESQRVRKVVVCFYLEDGTLSISEPKGDNSGFAFQGTLMRRHQVPCIDTPNAMISLDHLSVGQTLNVYNRIITLVDADVATRSFLDSIGMANSPAINYPVDNYTELRKPYQKPKDLGTMASALNASGMKVKLTQTEIRATKQFLENDRQVLRLDAVWDDTAALYGQLHYFTVYYFIADDTIEVIEKPSVNSGRDPFPSFVRRQKMVKPRREGSMRFENSANLTFKKDGKDTFYTADDLRIGTKLSIYGRCFLIYDYDAFTRQYLRDTFGVTEYTPIDVSQPPPPQVKRDPPPYNGYGDEADSLGSWKSLEPKVPRKDQASFLKHGNNSVKFLLKLDNSTPTDEIRRFVLTYYLADDTLSIFEPVQRNSGIVGGKFLQRQKVKNANGQYFLATDFFVGASIVVNGFTFVVVSTDERSLNYMESHSSEFVQSNINYVLSKVQAMALSRSSGLEKKFKSCDADGTGHLDVAELTQVFKDLSLPMSDHEILTVLRYFDRNGDGSISYSEFISRVLPDGQTAASDPRDWETIFSEENDSVTAALSVKDKIDQQVEKVANTTAAYGARALLEAYNARRQLFHQELKFMCDYSVDGKIGEKEFRECILVKLQTPLSDAQMETLVQRLFPAGARRVTYEELLRLMNNTSNMDHNLEQIKKRR